MAASPHGKVVVVTGTDHFKQEVEQAKACKKTVVIDFTATWCGPCRFMAPVFADLSEKYPDVVFLKVDVDEQAAVAKEYDVEAMPTFAFLKDGELVDKLVGASKDKLVEMVKQLATAPASASA